jgi:hypothetical protein
LAASWSACACWRASCARVQACGRRLSTAAVRLPHQAGPVGGRGCADEPRKG